MPFQIPAIKFSPIPLPEAIVLGQNVRFTVITSRLLRLEYSPSQTFEDRPSQAVWYRRQELPQFQVSRMEDGFELDTSDLHLVYKNSPAGFSPAGLQITVKKTGSIWQFGDRDWQNLKGTGRTLDAADGEIELEQGLISRSGWAVVDDSNSLVFNSSGWLETRHPTGSSPNTDLYFFGYGHDYIDCIQDYLRITGKVPLVPRWALGNWWSRYWEYSQDELTDLILRFKELQVPLSVCIIDMDWHITKTGNKSSGWTGYTWNKNLFPDPGGFLAWLHTKMGLRTAMNLHPADGVWPHEDQYPLLAAKMGVNPGSGLPVSFDIADPQFAQHYFEVLHHPYEAMGVDFWWMDWQQGARIANSKTELARYLDPLWWLNHLHFHDLGRSEANRPFIFSRWGGLGNHRYPIGFSGDTVVSWKSLAFQPYFTATAANVAFGWWSHDIGGHMAGMEDAELYTRWVQFGVFSPILRLHSTKNPFQDRAPWAFGEDIFKIARDALQLRHALIPYIYSMAWRFCSTGIPLSAPMYYFAPEDENAYNCPNQYMFGDQLLVCPFVTPRDPDTNLSRTTVWLPEGDWYHFFSGEHYSGGQWITIYGALDEIPVFARAGAVIPLAPKPDWGGLENPAKLFVHIFPGQSGEFVLYEDDGVSSAYNHNDFSLTSFSLHGSESDLTLEIRPVSDNIEHLPANREYEVVFHTVRCPAQMSFVKDGESVEANWVYDPKAANLTVSDLLLAPGGHIVVSLIGSEDPNQGLPDRREETILKYLRLFRLGSGVKHGIAQRLPLLLENPNWLGMGGRYLTDSQLAALQHGLTKR